jgi:hypothetical protein
MTVRAGRSPALFSLCLAALAGPLGAGCHKGAETLGLPDAYLMFAPVSDGAGHPLRSPSGLPVLEPLPLDDGRAAPYHKMFAVGFAGEMLRTDYLVKQFVREIDWHGQRFAPATRAAAAQPTVFVLRKEDLGPGLGLAVKGLFGAPSDRADVSWIGLTDDPERDAALPQTVTAQLGRRIASTVAAGAAEAAVLVDGYASAMEVIAREWRVGEGPRGALAPDAGTEAQREIFAAVRQNRFVTVGDGGPPRPAAELLRDPGVAATVIYRMAQSKRVGSRIAPVELYAPFVSQRVPAGVSPAAVLGPFRNFQAKLIAVWGHAVLGGRPPHDIAELVQDYAAELPAERAEVIRLFVVTTLGATIKPGGVTVKGGDATAALPELTALAAEVTAGRRSLRAALNGGK